MENNLLQLGAVAVIFMLAIREFFAYLKSKKVNGEGSSTHDRKVFDELKIMNENHLHSIEKAIIDGNREIVKAISDGNLMIARELGEIKGNLNK